MESNKKFLFLLIIGIYLIIIPICYIGCRRDKLFQNINPEPLETVNNNLQPSLIQKVFSIIADPPESENWIANANDEYPIIPDSFGIDSEGCYVSHKWDESANISRNSPSIHWERNVSIPEDMSNCNIISASVNAIVNATVHANNGDIAGIDCPGDPVDIFLICDYVRFYVLLTDLENNFNKYQVAYNQTIDLGKDVAGAFDYMSDTFLTTASEEELIFYLEKVLETDNHNFTIILGIDIFCEDNYILNDIDYWDNLRIKSFNLTFTYEIFPPSIQINEPKFGQVFGGIAPIFNISIINTNLDTMWYTLDDGITNITFTELTGTINQTEWDKLDSDSVTLIFYANDTAGNLGFAQVIIYKDTISPQIVINVPLDGAFFGNTAPYYNISLVELNLKSTWYTLDDGLTNITFTELTGAINQTEWDKLDSGSISLSFYANDTAGNLGFAQAIIYKDTISPQIVVNAPLDGAFFGNTALHYNISLVELNLKSTWYTLDDGLTNITFTELTGAINQTEWDKLDSGSVTLSFYANDTAGNLGFAQVIIHKDTISPQLVVNAPLDGAFFGNTAPYYNISLVELNLDSTWYTLDGGITHISFTELTGTINQTEWDKIADDVVIITFYANDTVGNLGFTQVIIYKDTISPQLVVNTPLDGVFFGDTVPYYNISLIELNLDSTWYTLDGGITNISFTELTGTINKTEWDELDSGSITLSFYANDSAGNVGFTQVLIHKDTISPQLVVNAPLDGVFFGDTVPFYNISLIELNLDSTWYTLDGGITNIAFTELTGTINQTEWDKFADDTVIITFYANDIVGNIGFAQVIIYKDTIPPQIVVNAPLESEFFGNTVPFYNLSLIESNLNSTWYTLDGGITNIAFTELTGTINQTEWDRLDSNSVTLIFYANDTVGNIGFAQVIIYKDTIPPQIVVNAPLESEFFGNTVPFYNLSLIESNLNSTWYTLDDGLTNVTFIKLTGTINQTEWDKLDSNSVTLIFYANDTVGNVGFIQVIIYKDIDPPTSHLSFVAHSGNDTVNKSTTFRLTADDGLGSGISVIRYKVNDSFWINYTKPFNLSEYVYGYYNISYIAVDVIGNSEVLNSIIVELVELPTELPPEANIPGYDVMLLLGIISLVSLFLVGYWKRKSILL